MSIVLPIMHTPSCGQSDLMHTDNLTWSSSFGEKVVRVPNHFLEKLSFSNMPQGKLQMTIIKRCFTMDNKVESLYNIIVHFKGPNKVHNFWIDLETIGVIATSSIDGWIDDIHGRPSTIDILSTSTRQQIMIYAYGPSPWRVLILGSLKSMNLIMQCKPLYV